MDSRKLIAAAMAVASLVACGGGDGGGAGTLAGLTPVEPGVPVVPQPTPEPPSPVPVDETSSAACFNAADLNEGTTRETELRVTHANGNVSYSQDTTITGPREAFAGAQPIPLSSVRPEFQDARYLDLIDGRLISYGTRTIYANGAPATTSTDTPPGGFPIAMQPGQKDSIGFVTVATEPGGQPVSEIRNTVERLYEGRELVQFTVGTFDACKFTDIHTLGSGAGAIVVETERWTAAEGPYRGHDLRFKTRAGGGNGDAVYEVTRLVYSPK